MRYRFFRALTLLLRLVVKLPFCPMFAKELVAASSNGYAKRMFDAGEYTKVYEEVKIVVALDLPEKDPYLARARYILFCLYYKGYGVKENKKNAIDYLILSIDGDDEIAIKQYKFMRDSGDLQPVLEIEKKIRSFKEF